MASTQNPITANREINDQTIHHNSNFDDGPEKGTELSPSTKADHVLNLESLIDETLYSIKRAIGGYYYYDVFTIFIRPFTLFITANSAFQKYSSQAGADDQFEIFLTLGAYVLAILAFMYSFPFLVAKSEQASYMVKIHYPFLMSNQLGDAVCRNVMFNVLQNMREEAAILTLLLGTITELFLIFGNFFLFVANIISTSAGSSALAIATIAALNLSASLYSFYQYCVFCMKIMVYRSKNSPLIYFCCCLCFQCVPEDAQVQTDLVKIDTDFGDTSRFFATDFAMPFQSKEYSEKYTLKREKHTDDQFDVALDLNEVQKSIPVVDGKVPFDVRDRFGLLSISGDAYLHNLERKDAAQYAKEQTEANGGSSLWSTFSYLVSLLCSFLDISKCCGYCWFFIHLAAMYYISLLYAMLYGVWYALGWCFLGYDFEGQLKTSCQTVAAAMKDDLTPNEYEELNDGETLITKRLKQQEITNTHGEVLENIVILREIENPMPWGLAWMAPISKLHPAIYFLTRLWPLRPCRIAEKFTISSTNLLNINTVAEIVIRSNNVIPHHLLKGFPFTYWPLDEWHDLVIVTIGIALQKMRDVIEDYELKKLGMPMKDGAKPTEEQIDTIINLRQGHAVKMDLSTHASKTSEKGVESMAMDRAADKV